MIPTLLLRPMLCVMLYACCSLLVASCAITQDAVAGDVVGENEYFSSWEFKYSDKYRLIWYYNTEEDRNKNQPNWVLARDKKFFVRPDVRPPTVNGIYLLENSNVYEGEEVLDIGTGTGIHAIFAAEKAGRVVATDIYEPAIVNARANAKMHGVENKIDFRVGDLFEPIKEGEKFDVFFVNINFPFAVGDDDRNTLHERLFSQVRKYMKPGARIYFQTSFIKNMGYIYKMLGRHDFRIMQVRMDTMIDERHEALFIMVQSF